MTETIGLPALATVPNVDLVAAGTWQLSTGTATFTTDDLAAAVNAAQCPAVGAPVIKLGHTDPRFDGEPAVGHVANMTLAAEGNKVAGDLADMPGWLAAICGSAYPGRSIEGSWDFMCSIGHVHPFVITSVALLGVSAPGVGVLSTLNDVAALYGLAEAKAGVPRVSWRLNMGGGVMAGGKVLAAGVTTEDVRRAYYGADSTPFSYWITEMQVDPPQLIVSDEATAKVYRVPITISGTVVTFGDPVEVVVEYMDVAASRVREGPLGSTRVVVRYADAKASRNPPPAAAAWSASTQVGNLGGEPTQAQLNAMYALPGDTKSASKLPHHDVSSDGNVGAANPDGCSAAIGAINGAHGGLTGVSAADLKKAYNHCAKHLTDAGKEAPEFQASSAGPLLARLRAARDKARAAAADTDADESVTELLASLDATLDQASQLSASVDRSKVAEDIGQALDLITAAEAIADQLMDMLGVYDPDDPDAAAGGVHGAEPTAVTHSHPHAAYGSQGGDGTHEHEHTHAAGSASHKHHMASAGGATQQEGATVVDFTEDQLKVIRAKLGKKDGDALTPGDIAAAFAAAPDSAGTVSIPDGSGMHLVDEVVLSDWQKRAAAGDVAAKALRDRERDDVLGEAIRAGKIPQARLEHYQRLWDLDQEGTRTAVKALAAGVVPVGAPIGHPGYDPDMPGSFEDQSAYRTLYPEDAARNGAGRHG